MCDMSRGPVRCVCGCFSCGEHVCVCVLCIQSPSVWWPDTVWESVCGQRIHAQHKGPIMGTHLEKEKGGRGRRGELNKRGDNRGLSISGGGMVVSLPFTSPSFASPQTDMRRHEQSGKRNSWGRKQDHSFSDPGCD